jgi:hypothetical protein
MTQFHKIGANLDLSVRERIWIMLNENKKKVKSFSDSQARTLIILVLYTFRCDKTDVVELHKLYILYCVLVICMENIDKNLFGYALMSHEENAGKIITQS